MKKKNNPTEKDLSSLAAEYREDARLECDELNEAAYNAAVAKFEKCEAASEIDHNVDYLVNLIDNQLEDLQKGASLCSWGKYDAELIARILSYDTTVGYTVAEIDEGLHSDKEIVDAYESDCLIVECEAVSPTSYTRKQNCLVESIRKYATGAAAYAKYLGSVSLMEWVEIIDLLNQSKHLLSYLVKSDAALRMIELQRAAVDHLRLEKIVAELPKYRPAKSPKK